MTGTSQDVYSTGMKTIKFGFTWTMHNFSLWEANVEGAQFSPKFPPGPDEQYQWTLKYVPQSLNHDTSCSLYVQMTSPLITEPKVLAYFEINATDSKGLTIVHKWFKACFGNTILPFKGL